MFQRAISRTPFWRVCQIVILAIVLGLSLGSEVRAQTVDWLVNIDDAGFDPSPAGGTIEYTVDIDNNGFGTAPATTVDIDVFANTQLDGISGDFTDCVVGGLPLSLPVPGPETVTCDVPPLPSLGQATSVVQILTQQFGVIELTATVPPTGDGLPGNNTLTEETTVNAGPIWASILSLPATAASGSIIPLDCRSLQTTARMPQTDFDIRFPIPTGLANITGPAGGPLPAGCSSVPA